MERKTLKGYARTDYNKRANVKLRKQGRIPAVIYGSKGSNPISVDDHEFNTKFQTVSENTLIELSLDKNSHDVLVKDFQEDIISGKILHIDFFEVEKGKALKTNVPLHLTGTSIGVRGGGVMEQLMHEIEVECLPKDIPQSIEIDVTELAEGSSIHVADITSIENVRFLSADDSVVVTITHVKGIEESVEEEAEEEDADETASGDAEE